MKNLCLATMAIACLSPQLWAQSVEYLPGIEWPEPQVVAPGEHNTGPPSDAVVLFDGKDLSAWNGGERWKVENGEAIVTAGHIHTKQSFGDCQLHVEWSAPLPVKGKSQGRGNSGIYLMGLYEVQVLDSYNNKTYFDGQAGAIYKQSPPMVNAIRPPGQWNVYDILFTAPRFAADGTLKSPAYLTVLHNGVLIHNHYELAGETKWHEPTSYEPHPAKLPIKLQDHGNPVRYRNIWVREFKQLTGKQVKEPEYVDHATGKKWKASEKQAVEKSTKSESARGFFYELGQAMAQPRPRSRRPVAVQRKEGVVERVPRFMRWKPHFEFDSSSELAECFDHYHIAIGILGKDDKAHLARNLSQEEPVVVTMDPREVTDGYIAPRELGIESYVDELEEKAGIATSGEISLIFFPFKVESILWTLENKANNGGSVDNIRQTEFTFFKKNGKFEISVKSIKHVRQEEKASKSTND